jgi:hypothetical protein
MDYLGILEEENQGQDYRFYVYNYDNEEVVSWFNTYLEAEKYINDVKHIMEV